MARGDGVARVRHAPAATRLPEGREPGDARGATWPWIIGGMAFAVGVSAAAAIYTAGQLELANRDGVAWLKNISGPVATLLGLIVGGLVVKVMNNVGRTMRGQGALGSNQVVLDRKLDDIVATLRDFGSRLTTLEKPAAQIPPAAAEALVRELSALKESVNAVAGKVGRANATGGQPAVPERPRQAPVAPVEPVGEWQPRRHAASDPATQDPFDKSRAWHSGLTDQSPALLPEMPPQPSAPSYTDPVGRGWEERLRRPRGT